MQPEKLSHYHDEVWNGWPWNHVSDPGRDKGVSSRACRLALWTNEHPNQWVLKRPSPRSKADKTWSWLLTSLPCGSKKCARYTSNPPYLPSHSDIKGLCRPHSIQGAPKHTQHYSLLWVFPDWISLFWQEAVFWIPVMISEQSQQHTHYGLDSPWF